MQECSLQLEVVEFPFVVVFHFVVILTQKKNAYLENEFILRHRKYVKNISWIKS